MMRSNWSVSSLWSTPFLLLFLAGSGAAGDSPEKPCCAGEKRSEAAACAPSASASSPTAALVSEWKTALKSEDTCPVAKSASRAELAAAMASCPIGSRTAETLVFARDVLSLVGGPGAYCPCGPNCPCAEKCPCGPNCPCGEKCPCGPNCPCGAACASKASAACAPKACGDAAATASRACGEACRLLAQRQATAKELHTLLSFAVDAFAAPADTASSGSCCSKATASTVRPCPKALAARAEAISASWCRAKEECAAGCASKKAELSAKLEAAGKKWPAGALLPRTVAATAEGLRVLGETGRKIVRVAEASPELLARVSPEVRERFLQEQKLVEEAAKIFGAWSAVLQGIGAAQEVASAE